MRIFRIRFAEDEPESLVITFGHCFHLQRLAIERERHDTRHGHVVDIAHQIRHLDRFWFRVRLVGGLHAVGRVERVVDGLEVVDTIATAPTKKGGEGSTPQNPARIESVEILEA